MKECYECFRFSCSIPFQYLNRFQCMCIPVIKIRRPPWYRLIFTMGILILVRQHLYVMATLQVILSEIVAEDLPPPLEERFEFQINSRFVHSSRNQRHIHVLPLSIDVVLTLFNFYRGQSVVPLLVIFCIKLTTCYITHMMTSSSVNFFHATGLLWGEFMVTGELPPQRPVARSFDVFFDLRPNKRLSKPSRRRWFETLSR